ncbi:2-C-methyl-D-erythritol 4-phosphate cytidylyltransferase [Spirosoma sp. KUDC1026]|uniref:2-C-methyl-D-erythritol 4-phosphate cytidylyltransferase n=1 Tax=Spirosoma sp. KUDC1026 TaxID=2745947 RepID=UPI00159BA289|nr:2-C-methyl-D-erythritol 4-phosphate cytidylyltransferase [Spirosoma sp. KUDC1026]QKZ15804.1 2-C-methyl-D-erythritol 4-phosphate cytidylyltransferase [Spirosoma sp. KUDC1026]
MKASVSKQFLLLQGKPILQRTIERFLAVTPTPHIILVLPERDLAIWQNLCVQHQFFPDDIGTVQSVLGGDTRFQSVRNGLAAIQASEGLVAVHDGVRPFISPGIIEQSYRTAEQMGSAVTCVAVKDSVRVVDAEGRSQAVDRNQYRLVQTPQTFRLDLFRQAFQTEEQPFFTDCASVVEHAGQAVTLIDGSYENIKITTPEDLIWGQQANLQERM